MKNNKKLFPYMQIYQEEIYFAWWVWLYYIAIKKELLNQTFLTFLQLD